jgi:spermidine synthase
MLAIGLLIFFVSGFSALLYQVVWQRLLGLFAGGDVYAATITVGAFMGGLGCGSLVGGWLADRLSKRGTWGTFAVAEVAVGLFGLFSPVLYYDVLYLRFGHLAAPAASMPAVLFVSLLWPTFFMGMSLPLLVRALTSSIEDAAPTVGALYGLNALGASVGALFTTWVLLPEFGLEGALRIGALLNIGAAVAAALLAARVGGRERQWGGGNRLGALEPPAPVVGRSLAFPVWLGLYCLAGFLALSLEIVWFRTLGVIVKSTTFTFGTLLAVYLGGLGLGAAAGSSFARRLRDAAMPFLLIQTVIGVYAGASLVLLLSSLDLPAFVGLTGYLGQYEPIDIGRTMAEDPARLFRLYLGIPAVLIGPPTLLMGLSVPLLQKMAQTDFSRLGSRIGTLTLANILGSTLGAILTGWLALRYLGTAGTLKVVVAMCGLFALLGLFWSISERPRRWTWAASFVLAILACGGAVAALPVERALWAALHGVVGSRIISGEDETGLSVLKLPSGLQGPTEVFVNGLGQSWLPYGDVHTALGALPALIHPDPRDVAVIGLGSGDTVFGMAGRKEIERITCIEIIRPQLDTLKEFDRRLGNPGLKRLLNDPRVRHITGDGRRFAMRTDERFDIIEADALRPASAFAGNLYSDQYFMLLRDHLKPGGLAVTWAPTPRVQRTFIKVFPYVVRYQDILLGSRDPINTDAALIRTRVRTPHIREYFGAIDIVRLIDGYVSRPPEVFDPGYDRSTIVDINTDLFPRDELDLPPFFKSR